MAKPTLADTWRMIQGVRWSEVADDVAPDEKRIDCGEARLMDTPKSAKRPMGVGVLYLTDRQVLYRRDFAKETAVRIPRSSVKGVRLSFSGRPYARLLTIDFVEESVNRRVHIRSGKTIAKIVYKALKG